MNYLPNGCRYSDFNVFPANWNTSRASLKKKIKWRIEYYFYDPSEKEMYPKGKPKVIKAGVNRISTLEGRQQLIRDLMTQEKDLLENKGYNPIKNKLIKNDPLPDPVEVTAADNMQCIIQIDDRSLSTKQYLETLGDHVPQPSTPFITALWLGLKRTRGVPNMINDIGSVIRGTELAAKELGFDALNISSISRKHIVLILEKCAKINLKWSENRHGVYKAYLRKIFKPLVTLESIEMNPVVDIEIDLEVDIDNLEEEGSIDDILSIEERKQVNDHLFKNNYTFWRFTQIFFHSGARETELMRLSESHVDLVKQQFKVLIKKRNKYVWVQKVIKDIALPFWREIMAECETLREAKPADKAIFLFSKFLQPGYKPIRPDQICRRWAKYVMDDEKGLGIKKGFYDIKHLHTTEIMDILSEDSQSIEEAEKDIADFNNHTTTVMVKNVYDVGNKDRKDNRIKKVGNSFA
jgi:integrase/uncharacterized protein (UPF0297 family)